MEKPRVGVVTTVDGRQTRIRAAIALAREPHDLDDAAALREVKRAVESELRRRGLVADEIEHEVTTWDEDLGRFATARALARRAS